MKLPVRIVLALLCACLVLAMPFVISAPNLLEDSQWEIIDVLDAQEESGWLRLLLPQARAEEQTEEAGEEETEEKEYALPMDQSPGMPLNPALITPDGYEDDSIRVQLETREGEKGILWRIAWVEIVSPTQLRTAYAGETVKKNRTGYVSRMAQEKNAVVAVNGDNYAEETKYHTYIIRMGEVRRTEPKKNQDILVTDENGDFHTFINSEGIEEFAKEHQIVNAFMFGPALVHEGEKVTHEKYYFNPQGTQPRCAIGQIGPLSYVLVIADNPTGSDSQGPGHAALADMMLELGCREAYNLDGGGSAVMMYNGKMYNNKAGRERDVTDMIYFATAVSPEDWEE